MGKNREETARMQGMSYALRVAKEKGIEGLEKEIERRGILNIPLIDEKTRREFENRVKCNTIDTILIMTENVLRDEYGFGKDRLNRFRQRFNEKTECLLSNDVTWEDLIYVLKDECAIEETIRQNNMRVQ